MSFYIFNGSLYFDLNLTVDNRIFLTTMHGTFIHECQFSSTVWVQFHWFHNLIECFFYSYFGNDTFLVHFDNGTVQIAQTLHTLNSVELTAAVSFVCHKAFMTKSTIFNDKQMLLARLNWIYRMLKINESDKWLTVFSWFPIEFYFYFLLSERTHLASFLGCWHLR